MASKCLGPITTERWKIVAYDSGIWASGASRSDLRGDRVWRPQLPASHVSDHVFVVQLFAHSNHRSLQLRRCPCVLGHGSRRLKQRTVSLSLNCSLVVITDSSSFVVALPLIQLQYPPASSLESAVTYSIYCQVCYLLDANAADVIPPRALSFGLELDVARPTRLGL